MFTWQKQTRKPQTYSQEVTMSLFLSASSSWYCYDEALDIISKNSWNLCQPMSTCEKTDRKLPSAVKWLNLKLCERKS